MERGKGTRRPVERSFQEKDRPPRPARAADYPGHLGEQVRERPGVP